MRRGASLPNYGNRVEMPGRGHELPGNCAAGARSKVTRPPSTQEADDQKGLVEVDLPGLRGARAADDQVVRMRPDLENVMRRKTPSAWIHPF